MRVDCSTWRSNMLPCCYFLCTQFTRLVSKEGKNLPENKRPAEYNRFVPDKMLDTYKYVNCIPVNHSHTNQAAIQYRVNHILDCKCLSNACNTHYDAQTCKFIGSAEEGHIIVQVQDTRWINCMDRNESGVWYNFRLLSFIRRRCRIHWPWLCDVVDTTWKQASEY